MVRNYVRKTVKSYTEDDILAAIECVHDSEDHRSQREIARSFKIGWSTFHKRLKNPNSAHGSGRTPVLTDEDEKYLIEAILHVASFGWPTDKEQVCLMVKSYVDIKGMKTPFKDNKPGHEWYQGFLKRHEAKLSIRKPGTVTKPWALTLTDNTLD